eukprot:CAMPEP_0172589054 /NCGR_PEP_ID=MMETSP1068-20121228/7873_1 /TAXON_ID=35684 /ORGANISM="Pseudopedinella elastica, Strain CCMP716" /LENGTH=247 /DNA_ID=CAMNT_0013384571 /DNA_START=207 /DNA_END=950 /DNA_ORIENTATION=-
MEKQTRQQNNRERTRTGGLGSSPEALIRHVNRCRKFLRRVDYDVAVAELNGAGEKGGASARCSRSNRVHARGDLDLPCGASLVDGHQVLVQKLGLLQVGEHVLVPLVHRPANEKQLEEPEEELISLGLAINVGVFALLVEQHVGDQGVDVDSVHAVVHTFPQEALGARRPSDSSGSKNPMFSTVALNFSTSNWVQDSGGHTQAELETVGELLRGDQVEQKIGRAPRGRFRVKPAVELKPLDLQATAR